MNRQLKSNSEHRQRGFTLIEILIVLLILSVFMAVSFPIYLSAVSDSQKKTCRANMQSIANGVRAARIKFSFSDFSPLLGSISTSLEPDLATLPICPNGGAYSINVASASTTGFLVSCSYSGPTAHGTFEPGIDSR